MIRHIVFFSARRTEDVEAVRTGLLALGNIPHSSLFEVTLNTKVDPLSDAIDVVVYAETTSKVKPLRELRYSADVVSAV